MGFAMCGAAEALPSPPEADKGNQRRPLIRRYTGNWTGRASPDQKLMAEKDTKNMGGHRLTYRPAISLEIWAKTELQKTK